MSKVLSCTHGVPLANMNKVTCASCERLNRQRHEPFEVEVEIDEHGRTNRVKRVDDKCSLEESLENVAALSLEEYEQFQKKVKTDMERIRREREQQQKS